MKPLIGITTYREQSRWGVWDEKADILHAVYSLSIEAAGGVAVLLPPSDATAALSVVARIDGLVIAGGADVDPWQYGAEPHEHTKGVIGKESHSPGAGVFGDMAIDVIPGTRLAGAIGDRGDVACHHHQSVREHPGFIASAHAADGTLEAMEREDRPYWMAVQWHPETKEDAGLFRSLVDAASQ